MLAPTRCTGTPCLVPRWQALPQPDHQTTLPVKELQISTKRCPTLKYGVLLPIITMYGEIVGALAEIFGRGIPTLPGQDESVMHPIFDT